MTKDEALKLALEALEKPSWSHAAAFANIKEAITVLRQAIAEAEKQEPVAWVECDGELVWNNREAAIGRNLYTAPPQRHPLTGEEAMAEVLGTDVNTYRRFKDWEAANGIKGEA